MSVFLIAQPLTQPRMRSLCLVAIVAYVLFTGSSCEPGGCANEKRYDLKGKVVAVNTAAKTASIDHEEVVGYMEAMTMDFTIKRDSDLEMIKSGSQITGTLVVNDCSSWVEITTSIDGISPLSPTAEVPGEPKPGDEVPDFTLINQDGKRISLKQYRGRALALTFIYTRCPDANQCPLMSTNFAAIDQELQKQPEAYKKTHLLSITFDPDYDTPKVLRSYGAGHTGRYTAETFAHWEFATGSKAEIKSVAQYFAVQYFQDAQTGQDKLIHSLRTAVIGPDGKLIKMYRGNEWKPSEIVNDLRSSVGITALR